MAKRKINTTLKRITTRARSLQRSHPNTKWTDLIKKASREIKGKKKAPTRTKRRKVASVKYIDKGEKKNVRPSKVYRIKRNKRGTFKGYSRVAGGRTLGDNLRDARNILLSEIEKLSTRKFLAKRKTDKKRIQKDINAKRSQYKKLVTK
jgi:hypothetical protein